MANDKRKLASIQTIMKIEPVENADKLEVATILGWKVVVKKDEFKEGDKVVFFEIDSFLPIDSRYEFLRKSSYRKNDLVGEGFRLKTVRLRGQISQGLILPLDIFPEFGQFNDYEEGHDVTSMLSVQVYDTPASTGGIGAGKSKFHPIVQKTDETRIQTAPELLKALYGKPYYITEKIDGMSVTVMIDGGELKVYTRNMEILPKDAKGVESPLWKFFRTNGVLEALQKYGEVYPEGLFVQGEYYGEGIQKNNLKIKGKDYRFFNLGNPQTGEVYSYELWNSILERVSLKDVLRPVKVLEKGASFAHDAESLMKLTEGNYDGAGQREGIVIRPQKEEILSNGTRLSFKVINNKYLLKNE